MFVTSGCREEGVRPTTVGLPKWKPVFDSANPKIWFTHEMCCCISTAWNKLRSIITWSGFVWINRLGHNLNPRGTISQDRDKLSGHNISSFGYYVSTGGCSDSCAFYRWLGVDPDLCKGDGPVSSKPLTLCGVDGGHTMIEWYTLQQFVSTPFKINIDQIPQTN